MPRNDDALLRYGLRANALFSSLSALVLLLGSGPLAPWIGAPRSLLLAIGAGLALFAADLVITSRRSPIPRAKGISFVVMDVLWVVGSIVVLAVPTPLTGAGRAAVAMVALVVASLAAVQANGIRRRGDTSVEQAPSRS